MRKEYQELFDGIHASHRLREEVLQMTKQERGVSHKRRISRGILVAAVLVLALTGTTLAAVGMPRTLRDWFAMEWQERTDSDISQEQMALIDGLTQEVGASDTQNGVTVTLDSITVGNSSMWMMLHVSGAYGENEDLRYHFDGIDLTMDPDPEQQHNTPGGYGFDYPYSKVSSDGTLMVLVRFEIDLAGLSSLTDTHRQVTLLLENVVCNDMTDPEDEDLLLTEGSWTLQFDLEPQALDAIQIPGQVQADARSTEGGANKTVTFWDVEITATDITYVQSREDQMYDVCPVLVLEDGAEIEVGNGASRFRDEAYTEWSSVWYWPVPVDLSQAAALRIGETEIPLT